MRDGAVLFIALIFSGLAQAACLIDNSSEREAHFLVNGVINRPIPEIVFDLPGANLGDGGTVVSTTVNDRGNGSTPVNHVRFRLRVQNRSSTPFLMQTDSSTPLSCTNCSSSVQVSLSKLSWVVGLVQRGNSPAPGTFNNNVQTWINSGINRDNLFHSQFFFLNDEILPAGTYTGRFFTRGVPD